MRTRFSIAALFVAALALSLTAWAAPRRFAKVTVDFQHPVNIGTTTLQPGHYVFTQVHGRSNTPEFRVSTPQGQNIALTAIAVRSQVPQKLGTGYPLTATQTQVVLQKIDGTYYLDKIWVQGHARGFEFAIPKNATSQASQAQVIQVPATYEENSQTAESNQNEMNDNQNSAAATSENQQAMNSAAASATRDQNSNEPDENTQSSNEAYENNSQTSSKTSNNQNMTNPSTTGQPPVSEAAENNTGQITSVTGCLQRASSPNQYYLQVANNNGEQVQVTPSAQLQTQLGKQVGHTVRLVGQWIGTSMPQSPSALNQSNPTGSSGNSSMSSVNGSTMSPGATADNGTGTTNTSQSAIGSRAFQVNRIDVVSEQCSM